MSVLDRAVLPFFHGDTIVFRGKKCRRSDLVTVGDELYEKKKCVYYMGEWRAKDPEMDYYTSYLGSGFKNMASHFHFYSRRQQIATRVMCYGILLFALALITLTFAASLTGNDYFAVVVREVVAAWQSVVNVIASYAWNPLAT